MFVYLITEAARQQPCHIMHVCPAADAEGREGAEAPSEWVSDNNEPLPFAVEFSYGKAEVPDHLGRYLVRRGLARKSGLILPQKAVAW